MNREQAVQTFWEGFDIPAYHEATVPEDAPFPRITYTLTVDGLGPEVSMSASIWFRESGWANITEKLHRVERKITRGGILLKTENGAVWIKKGAPFAQRLTDPDDSIRRILINLSVEYLTDD